MKKQKMFLRNVLILVLLIVSAVFLVEGGELNEETLVKEVFIPSPEHSIKTSTLLFLVQTKKDAEVFNELAKEIKLVEFVVLAKKGMSFKIEDEAVKLKTKTILFKQNPFVKQDPLFAVYSKDKAKLLTHKKISTDYLGELNLISEKAGLFLDALDFEFDKANMIFTDRHILLGMKDKELKDRLEEEFGVRVILIDQVVPEISTLITPTTPNTLVVGDPSQAQLARGVLEDENLKEIEQKFADDYLEIIERNEQGLIELVQGSSKKFVTEEEFRRVTKENLGKYVESSFEYGLELNEKINKIIEQLREEGYKIKRAPFLPTNNINPGVTPVLSYTPFKIGDDLFIPQYGLELLDKRALQLFSDQKPKIIRCGVGEIKCNIKILKQAYAPSEEELNTAKANILIKKSSTIIKTPLLEKPAPELAPEEELPAVEAKKAPEIAEETPTASQAAVTTLPPYTPGPRRPQHSEAATIEPSQPSTQQSTTQASADYQTSLQANTEVSVGGDLTVVVVDQGKNVNPSTTDVATIEVETPQNSNSITGSFWQVLTGWQILTIEGMNVSLTETGPNTGIFTGQIKIQEECITRKGAEKCFPARGKNKLLVKYEDSKKSLKQRNINLLRGLLKKSNLVVQEYELFVDDELCYETCLVTKRSNKLILKVNIKNKGEGAVNEAFDLSIVSKSEKSHGEMIRERFKKEKEEQITDLLESDEEKTYTIELVDDLQEFVKDKLKKNKLEYELDLAVVIGKGISISDDRIEYDLVKDEEDKENNKKEGRVLLQGDFPVEECGNNIKEENEECDGSDLDSQTCSLQRFESGVLNCTQKCTFEFSACIEYNDPPKFKLLQPTSAEVRKEYKYKIEVEDKDEVLFNLEKFPEGMTLIQKGRNKAELVWTPTNQQGSLGNNLHEVVIAADDQKGRSNSKNKNSFIITVGAGNHQPVFISTPIDTAIEGQVYTYKLEATDEDEDELVFSLKKAPPGMFIDENTNKIIWTPGKEHTKKGRNVYEVEVVVEDKKGKENSASTQKISITVQNVNDRPSITSTPQVTAEVGAEYSYQLIIEDADEDEVKYYLEKAPKGMKIDEETGLVTWTPAAEHSNKIHEVLISADDQTGENNARTVQEFTITVGARNHQPVFSSTPAESAVEGQEYTYQVQTIDADGDNLVYSLPVAPQGMKIDDTGLITWTPKDKDAGKDNNVHDVKVRINDKHGEDNSINEQDFKITVKNINNKPKIISNPSREAVSGEEYIYFLEGIDEDENERLVFEIVSGPPRITLVNKLNNQAELYWIPSSEQAGKVHTIRIAVNDQRGEETSTSIQEFAVSVSEGLAGGPDMEILDYYLTVNDEKCPENSCAIISPEEKIILHVNLKNHGAKKTANVFWVSVFKDLEEISKETITNMFAPGEERTIKLTLPNKLIKNDAETYHKLLLVVHQGTDTKNNKVEYYLLTNEEEAYVNNKEVSFFTKTAERDLRILDFDLVTVNPKEGESIELKAVIEDVNRNIDYNFVLKLLYDEIEFVIKRSDLDKHNNLYSYKKTISDPALLTKGPHIISLQVDPDKNLPEEKTDNNYKEVQFEVTEKTVDCPQCPEPIQCKGCPDIFIGLPFFVEVFEKPKIIQPIKNNGIERNVKIVWKTYDKKGNLLIELSMPELFLLPANKGVLVHASNEFKQEAVQKVETFIYDDQNNLINQREDLVYVK